MRTFGLRRAAVGLTSSGGQQCRLVAVSGLSQVERSAELSQAIDAALHEAILSRWPDRMACRLPKRAAHHRRPSRTRAIRFGKRSRQPGPIAAGRHGRGGVHFVGLQSHDAARAAAILGSSNSDARGQPERTGARRARRSVTSLPTFENPSLVAAPHRGRRGGTADAGSTVPAAVSGSLPGGAAAGNAPVCRRTVRRCVREEPGQARRCRDQGPDARSHGRSRDSLGAGRTDGGRTSGRQIAT